MIPLELVRLEVVLGELLHLVGVLLAELGAVICAGVLPQVAQGLELVPHELADLLLLIVGRLDLLLNRRVSEKDTAAAEHATAPALTGAALALAAAPALLLLGHRRPGHQSRQADDQRPLREASHRCPPFPELKSRARPRAHRGPLEGCAGTNPMPG